MPLSNSRVASSFGGQQSKPRSRLGVPLPPSEDPLKKAQAGLGQAAQTFGRMQQKGGSTTVTEGPDKTIAGGLTAGVSGVGTGIGLAGAMPAITAAYQGVPAAGFIGPTLQSGLTGAGGVLPALSAIPGIGWALGAISLGAYLFS